MRMKILITGNMGYVGPSVVAQLRMAYPDSTLIGFDNGYFGACISNIDVLPERKVNVQYFGDIRQFPENMLRGVDAIVHLAGISNDPIGNKFESVTFDVNYRATIELAKKAKAIGVRSFVFASSCSIYGAAGEDAKTEKSDINPLTTYAKSKMMAEEGLKLLASTEFMVTCLRFSTACGWSDRLRLDLVLNDFVAGAIVSNKIAMLSDGKSWRPLINVKDMARAIDWAIQRNSHFEEAFLTLNAGSDEWNYQVKDLAEAVAKIIPNVEISVNLNAQPDKRSYRVNFDLFKKLAPDYQPQVNLLDSISEIQEGLLKIDFKDQEFRNSNYIRLNTLFSLQKKGLLNEKFQWINK